MIPVRVAVARSIRIVTARLNKCVLFSHAVKETNSDRFSQEMIAVSFFISFLESVCNLLTLLRNKFKIYSRLDFGKQFL